MSYMNRTRGEKLRACRSLGSLAVIAGWFAIACAAPAGAQDLPVLIWDEAAGVQVKTPLATVQWDRNDKLTSPMLKFDRREVPLKNPQVTQPDAKRMKLVYSVSAPEGTALKVVRELTLTPREGDTDLVEEFQLTPEKPIATDLEITRPFTIAGTKPSPAASAVCPLFNGWARSSSLSGQPLSAAYQLGTVVGARDRLALPVVQLDAEGAWRAALSADCRFSAAFNASAAGEKAVQGAVQYRYSGRKVPVKGTETRTFALWLAPAPPTDEPFGKAMDSFFRLNLADVPPGPKWLHEIAMVYYDYLSENGAGWEKDMQELARLVKPEERHRMALCFHGWYETIGGYGYDDSTGKMKTEWTAMDRTRKVNLTQDEVKRRLRLAKQFGFRVLWYFADGVLQDSGAPFPGCYYPDWDWRDEAGNVKGGWQGPDTWGRTHVRNPAHPEVAKWYGRYLKALLEAYGPEVDGFVWDETGYIGLGLTTQKPEPAYCDRAMLDLMKALRQQVKAADPEKVFLASDCTWGGHANYAMMADGTYQDTWCKPDRWSYGLFPNWRNVLWSCNWQSVSHFSWTKWGVENLGTPVSLSNGYGDDKGPSEWTPEFAEAVVALFHKRLAKKPVRFLTEDPAKLLAEAPDAPPATDPIPAPAAGEKNWALAANGAKATASSEYDPRCGAAGLIDGVRDDTHWMNGHGWASQAKQPLPQWVEIAFAQPRLVSRFLVVNYGAKADLSSVRVWGVRDYEIEIWDGESNAWKPVVSEKRNRVMLHRVHVLDKPVRTTKFRLVVRSVVPADDIARLLQLEAWGKE
jgi:hypothetical protein